ncbi:sulfonate ABC transporter substrate-binding protein [Corticibacter populi]|uniref:Putative aliphatic sulfonates-binding protein n=1 Tax=Corticibacter populi TaxID=1550736 RepID=A0A3M6QGL3_9BURK|nr:sulfonate ABC transporter substrate-binding protein [Corticibacter populi]RMX02228.1 sulfonate ABC transporter substrate-binding protein [Corticibacter populi]RZS29503.1 sulfonate transport system substrate-binding protein [Corticibacter populi]
MTQDKQAIAKSVGEEGPLGLGRRHWLRSVFSAAAAGVVAGPAAWAQTPTARGNGVRVLRIGNQKGLLNILKARGTLEDKLASLNARVTWTEFNAGPVQLEALNVGSIDFGDVGEAPPIFAQAAGAPLAYVASSPPRPRLEALIVPKDSPIRSVADLKGKRLAYNKGSNVQYFLVKLLEKHGLQYSDVQSVFLPPADARAAFERGAVDGWLIWDPFLAAAEVTLGARQVADATGVVNNRNYYFSTLQFAKDNADIIKVVIEELNTVDLWARDNRTAAAEELAGIFGIPLEVVQHYLNRGEFGVLPITPEVLQEQQQIADTFLALKLIPKPLDLREAAV